MQGTAKQRTGIMQEFREFISRGNVVDLAVAVVIGAAFTSIVNSLVSDIINPVIGLLTNGIDFSNHYINLSGKTFATYADAKAAGAAVIGYGAFIQSVISFVIVAFAVFMVVKVVNQFYRNQAESPALPPAPSTEEKLLTEIRDLLARQSK